MQRATFSSLLARHYSYRLARGVRDQYPLPLNCIHCPRCGHDLRIRRRNGNYVCADCELRLQLPAHIAAQIRREEADYRADELADNDSKMQRLLQRAAQREAESFQQSLIIATVFFILIAIILTLICINGNG